MNLIIDVERVVAARDTVRSALLGERTVGGHWVGELSSSPLATATAISALVIAHGNGAADILSQRKKSSTGEHVHHIVQSDLSELIVDSLHWLAQRQNTDGGWGDTERDRSNVSATMLVQAAFRLTGVPAKYQGLTERAEKFVESQGDIAGLKKRYGKDKSLTAPILANLALAGLVPWRQVPALPFELAALPQNWHSRLRLPVVSYAIPALVAIGQMKFHHDAPRNPFSRMIRLAARKPSLAVLERMQPESGGFLEATPLTAFVVMGLAGMGMTDHPVVERGIEFLLASVRSDASWPIDTNLATWNTTLAMNALAEQPAHELPVRLVKESGESVSIPSDWHTNGRTGVQLAEAQAPPSVKSGVQTDSEIDAHDEKCLDWLLDCQQTEVHPYSGASPGGWAWTDLSGGIPDADDTAGALIALANWRNRYPEIKQHRLQLAARRGVVWLLELQNRDGGWPTFCRGWNLLQFDRSASDLTAHVIRALAIWQRLLPPDATISRRSSTRSASIHERIAAAIDLGLHFLEQEQRIDGSFVPLWFGNQHHPEGHNLVYGTARVLTMCTELGKLDSEIAQRAARWLLGVQHANGGWGPPRSSPATTLSNIYRSNTSRAEDALAGFCSVEETSLAVEALLPLAESNQLYARAVQNGLRWLTEAVEQGRLRQPSPIGFYFAKLWYHERLYPLVFATTALSRAANRLATARPEVAAPVG